MENSLQPLNYRQPPRPLTLPPGDTVRLEPFERAHATALQLAFVPETYRFLPYGPFESAEAFADHRMALGTTGDPMFYTIFAEGRALGIASYLRINPPMGTIEIGHIALSPALQQSRAGTEALSLMMRWAFEAGYRRVEWKCDALNRASRRAAQRLGFSFEGIHRQVAISRGRNRDTAWFSVLDGEWQAVGGAHRDWLSAANFAPDGTQETRLSTLTAPLLAARDPGLA